MSVFSCFFSSRSIRLMTLVASLFYALVSQATTVQFQTSMGDINVNLFDKTTPETVKNFLKYVDEGSYRTSVIHRSVTITNTDGSKRPFVVQGGGYTSPANVVPLEPIKSKGTVVNEPVYSNLRGTIAMAKPAQQPNGATSQWFFNMHSDNATSLDPNLSNSGGYTVFGQVDEASLAVLDTMVAVNIFVFGGGLNEFPLRNYTLDDYRNNAPVTASHFILINDVVVLNASADTVDSLSPTKNTLLVVAEEKEKSSGGGSLSLWFLLLVSFFLLARQSTLAINR